MAYATTSNQLSASHGVSPLSRYRRPAPQITRGIIIHIGCDAVADASGQTIWSIVPRLFCADYGVNNNFTDQADFEKEVIAGSGGQHGYANQYSQMTVNYRNKWPDPYHASLDAISFGWVPCYVSYILDVNGWAFHQNSSDPSGPNQPIIFRRDKVIVDAANVGTIHSYEPNHSFFDLEFHEIDGVSVLRMRNLMLDEYGQPIEEPKDADEAAKTFWRYCMDIQVRMAQSRKLVGNKDAALSLVNVTPPDWLTIVFDPPQDNGGTGGPPKY